MYSVENQEKFARLLHERNWSDVLSSEDPQSAYSLFSQGYIDMYNDFSHSGLLNQVIKPENRG